MSAAKKPEPVVNVSIRFPYDLWVSTLTEYLEENPEKSKNAVVVQALAEFLKKKSAE